MVRWKRSKNLQYGLIFRGSLIEYWQVANAEWVRCSRGVAHLPPNLQRIDEFTSLSVTENLIEAELYS
jgi:hypothetical protein